MQKFAVLFALLSTFACAETSNPLGKVIQLLDELAAKVTADGAAEEKAYKGDHVLLPFATKFLFEQSLDPLSPG